MVSNTSSGVCERAASRLDLSSAAISVSCCFCSLSPRAISTAPAGVPSKHVLQTWGSNDTYSPQPTLNMFGRGAGLPVVAPVIVDLSTGTANRPVSLNRMGGDNQQRTAAQFQYVPDGYDGHFVATRNPTAIADWTAFFTSLIATGTPTVP